ncbi:tyrosine-type recombinase/integrase [Leptotrichia trevisanii]|uniref:tyrosine-type recombinase/integrase n=1 Tax=Leptotrichia trevisanii TaxID=109328 RepID=UPI0034E95F13
MRHSHASYLLHKNVNIVAISKRLGHENIKTTLNTYSHLLPESQNFLVNILNSIDV